MSAKSQKQKNTRPKETEGGNNDKHLGESEFVEENGMRKEDETIESGGKKVNEDDRDDEVETRDKDSESGNSELSGKTVNGAEGFAMGNTVSTSNTDNQCKTDSVDCGNVDVCCDLNKDENSKNKDNVTYAKMLKKDSVNQDLVYIAPNVNKDGEETVVFDEEIVQKGSMKWINTVCGYFVGQNMSIHELRYHIY